MRHKMGLFLSFVGLLVFSQPLFADTGSVSFMCPNSAAIGRDQPPPGHWIWINGDAPEKPIPGIFNRITANFVKAMGHYYVQLRCQYLEEDAALEPNKQAEGVELIVALNPTASCNLGGCDKKVPLQPIATGKSSPFAVCPNPSPEGCALTCTW